MESSDGTYEFKLLKTILDKFNISFNCNSLKMRPNRFSSQYDYDLIGNGVTVSCALRPYSDTYSILQTDDKMMADEIYVNIFHFSMDQIKVTVRKNTLMIANEKIFKYEGDNLIYCD